MKFNKVVALVCPLVHLIHQSEFSRAMRIMALMGTRIKELGLTFEYQKELFSTYQGLPVTLENLSNGEFYKYNNCMYIKFTHWGMKSTYVKAQSLVHFTCIYSEGKCMLLNIQVLPTIRSRNQKFSFSLCCIQECLAGLLIKAKKF